VKRKPIRIYTYPTLRECLEAYFGLPYGELIDTEWEFAGVNDRRVKMTMRKAVSEFSHRRRWGFLTGKSELHLWVGRGCSLSQAVYLVAHELGHARQPFLTPCREEKKAEAYGVVAFDAVEIARRLLRRANAQPTKRRKP
jgi:hypothetical protein